MSMTGTERDRVETLLISRKAFGSKDAILARVLRTLNRLGSLRPHLFDVPHQPMLHVWSTNGGWRHEWIESEELPEDML